MVCAVLLPHVLRFNRNAAPQKYEVLTGVLGTALAEAAAWLLGRLRMPQRLGELGLSEADFDYITARSMPSGSLKANAREVAPENVVELLRAVRQDEASASLPVAIVTSKGSEEDRRRGAEEGADAYIVKEEFDQQALLETIGRLVGR